MTDDPPDNVRALPVQLRPKSGRPFDLHVNRGTPYCAHASKFVDEVKRIVECEHCKAVLDPFDVVREICREWDQIDGFNDRAKRETEAMETRLKLLKRMESNARANLSLLLNLGRPFSSYEMDLMVAKLKAQGDDFSDVKLRAVRSRKRSAK